ncbi:MFS transporter [Mastigocladopsis repens]|uniref:MFS transporter n=1 Tax=Mastigocladopsis repens TaxID=221287 RepID=UPI000525F7DD|nr:MFS transporter [Mastigocladopsis repens]
MLSVFNDFRLLVLLAAGSLTTMAGGVVAPIMPEMIQQLHLNPGLAGNLVSIHCLTIALFSPLFGILADRIGRVRVLVASLVLYALFGTAGAFMHSLGLLLVMRGLLGAASGGIAAASLGLLTSMYEGEARSQALGHATSTLTIAGIFFPLLGGWVGATHWQFAFYLYGLGLPLAFMAAFILRKSIPTKATAVQSRHKLSQVLGHGYTLWLLLSLSLASIAMYTVVIYAPLYLKATIGAGAALNGVVLASRAVGAASISAFGARQFAQSFGLERSTALGFGLMAVTLGTIPFLRQLGLIVLTAVLFGVGFGIVLPNLYNALANLAPAKLRSSVLAAGTGAGFLGQFLCPILLGPVLSYGRLEEVFYTAASVCLVAGLLLFLVATNTKYVNRNPPDLPEA